MREISSCCCLTTAGKTRQLLLNNIYIPFLPSLYTLIDQLSSPQGWLVRWYPDYVSANRLTFHDLTWEEICLNSSAFPLLSDVILARSRSPFFCLLRVFLPSDTRRLAPFRDQSIYPSLPVSAKIYARAQSENKAFFACQIAGAAPL